MADKKMTFRRKARELALQILFQKDFVPDLNIDSSISYFRTTVQEPEEVWSYCRVLVLGVIENEKKIDDVIAAQSAHWSLKRMASVDLNILRLSVFELTLSQDEVPPKVVIDEAIDIAKKYSTTDSGAFINGILDQIFKAKG